MYVRATYTLKILLVQVNTLPTFHPSFPFSVFHFLSWIADRVLGILLANQDTELTQNHSGRKADRVCTGIGFLHSPSLQRAPPTHPRQVLGGEGVTPDEPWN